MKLQEFRQQLEQDPEYLKAAEEMRLQLHLADVVLRARLKKGWSQAQLANAVGTKQANISRIEAGLANPTLSLIQKILKALDLELKIQPPVFELTYGSSSSSSSTAILVANWPQKAPCSDTTYETRSRSKTEEGILK